MYKREDKESIKENADSKKVSFLIFSSILMITLAILLVFLGFLVFA